MAHDVQENERLLPLFSLLLLLPVSSFSNAIHISFVRYRSLAYCVNLISHISTTL